MNSLSDDVIVSIFLILPVKILLRCRAVCKSWKAIINSSYFIDLHHNRPANTEQLLSYRNCQEVTLLSHHNEHFVTSKELLAFQCSAPHIKPVGSVRGILCFSSETSIYFCNLSTRKSKIIPNPYSHYLSHDTPKYGFGFASRTREFKLVRILSKSGCSHKNNSYQVSIYSSDSSSWRRVNNRLSCLIHGSESEATLDGIVHWRASSLTCGKVNCNFILAFGIDKEVFRRIYLPESCSQDVDYGIFRSSCGRFLHMYSVVPYMTFNVWVMTDYSVTSCWTKLFTVKDSLFWICTFFFIQRDDQLWAMTFGGSLIAYDGSGREVKRHLAVLKYHPWGMPVFAYKESLVWFNESTLAEKKIFGIKVVNYSRWLMISFIVLVASCFLMFVA